MIDILRLKNWEATSVSQIGREAIISADFLVYPTACPKCESSKIYKHGTKTTKYRDAHMRGYKILIEANIRRYKCRECTHTFLQSVTDIYPNSRMTERCVAYIEQECLRDTFTRIAENTGCDEKTVRSIAAEYIDKISADYNPLLSGWIGIDETMIDGKQRFVVADIVNRQLIEMLPDREHATVSNFLWKHRNDPIKGFAMDMWRPYKKIINTVFPSTPIVVDKFHVVRMANQAMDGVRLNLAKDEDKATGKDWMRRKSLLRMRYKDLDEQGRYHVDMWLENNPKLKIAHNLKELFYLVYDQENKDEAKLVLDEFIEIIPMEMRKSQKDFKPLITAVTNWCEEILAFFDYPATNAFTEAYNGIMKVINRNGRGYTFEVLRARALFNKREPIGYPCFNFAGEVTNAEIKEITDSIMRCRSCMRIFTPYERGPICNSCLEFLHPDDEFLKQDFND